jgi:hypothetical protein
MLSAAAGTIIILSIGILVAHSLGEQPGHTAFKKRLTPRHFFKKEHGWLSFLICRNPTIALGSAIPN